MALIACSECGKQVSDRAASCPHCGNPLSSAPDLAAQPQPNNPPAEREFFNDAHVRVTNTRVVIDNKTYSLANVSSVSLWIQPSQRAWVAACSIAFFIFGAVSFRGDMQGGCGVFSAVIGVILALVAVLLKPTYWVRLTAAGGETNAFGRPDREYIGRVIQAIQEAIVSRG